jgi:hypothetical protein
MTAYKQGQAFGGVIDVLEAIGAEYAILGLLGVWHTLWKENQPD